MAVSSEKTMSLITKMKWIWKPSKLACKLAYQLLVKCMKNIHHSNRTHPITNLTVFYTPNGQWQDELMEIFSKRLEVRVFPAQIHHIRRYLRRYKIFCGVHFHSPSTSLPKHLNYSLIFPNNLEFESPDNPFEDMHWITRMKNIAFTLKQRTPEDLPIYYKEGFLQVQTAIYLSFLEMTYPILDWRGKYTYHDFHVNLKQMPSPVGGQYVAREEHAAKWAEEMVFQSYLLPTYFLIYVSIDIIFEKFSRNVFSL